MTFSPTELDRIEDALEEVESGELPEGLSPQARERLEDYREVLTLSREALPMVEVPSGTLDGVLEQARAAAGRSPGPAAKDRGGVLGRIRWAVAVPTFALAGSAALVLWWVRPQEPDREYFPAAPVRSKAAPVKEEVARRPVTMAEKRDDGGRLREVEQPTPEPTQIGAADQSAERSESGAASSRSTRKKGSANARKGALGKGDDPLGDLDDVLGGDNRAEAPKSKKPAPSYPADVPKGGGKGMGKDVGGSLDQGIERGDVYRRRGRCDLARIAYKRALGGLEKFDARYQENRARAHAGIGLCDELEGDVKAAESRFARARKAWKGIEAFIRSERGYGGGAQSKKSKKRAAPNAEQQQPEDRK